MCDLMCDVIDHAKAIIFTYFTHIAALSTVTDDVTFYDMHRMFNTTQYCLYYVHVSKYLVLSLALPV